jgi:hypothetical protein
MSEKKPEGELAEVIQYIAEREENLSRYSDKLRQNLVRISNLFGSKMECRICGEEHVAPGARDHDFVPKIYVSLDIIDTEPFLVEEDEEGRDSYYLQLWESKLRIRMKRLYSDGEERFWDWRYFDDASRFVLKQLVKSGRLPKFLSYVAQVLQEKGQEYGEAAEVAAKMADAVNPT